MTAPAALVRVAVGRHAVRGTAVADPSVPLAAVHAELCRQVRARAPFPSGPVGITGLHGGSISINSHPGRGTQVILRMPAERLVADTGAAARLQA